MVIVTVLLAKTVPLSSFNVATKFLATLYVLVTFAAVIAVEVLTTLTVEVAFELVY